jgi:tetratricopeptide (TPR) repeat protein
MRADADTERYQLFDAVVDLLAEMSAAQPVVLVLDDIHWSDKPSLVLLRHLLRSATPMRLLVLCTYRDTDLDRSHPLSDALADFRRQPGVERLDLHGLDGDEVAGLMTMTAGHDLEQSGLDLARALHAETEGNPFFVGEVLRHLAETGVLVERDGRWTANVSMGDFGIPEGIREVVGRRLSRLSDAVNQALALAAVIGPVFDLTIVEGAGGPSGDELFDALDEATAVGLIREVPGTVGRYAFAHALVRSALYEELTTNRRVRMHWRIGEVIEARHSSDLDAHLDELAFHFSEGALAGDPMKAVGYASRAGELAVGELAYESAAAHFERALGSLELVDHAEPAVRCDLLTALAQAYQASGDERRIATVFEAVKVARSNGDVERLARAALVLVVRPASTRGGNVDDELVALLDEALTGIGDEPSPLRARVLASLAVELFWGPEVDKRMRYADEALELARAIGDPETLSYVLIRGWAFVDGSQPWVEWFTRLTDEAERAALETGDADALRTINQYAMWNAAVVGNRAESDARYEAYVRYSDQVRQPSARAQRMWTEAGRAAFEGRFDEAEQIVIDSIAVAQQADIAADSISGTVGSLFYAIRQGQGRLDELVPAVEDLVANQPGAPVWRVAAAGALVESDRVEDARPHFMWLAENDCANVPRDVEYPVVLCGLARLSFRIRPPEAITRAIHDRLAPFAGQFNWTGTSMAEANDLGLANSAAVLGLDDESDRHFAAALDLCERAGARGMLARSYYDWARVLAGRGDVSRAREHVEIAVAMGQELAVTGTFGVVARGQALLAELGA